MRVGEVELVDFRSYERAGLAFRPGVNLLLGPNGVGKTNVVEAVGYVSTLSSHRVSSDLPLVRQGADHAIVRAEVRRSDRDAQQRRSAMTEIAINPGRANRMQVSGSPVSARDVIGRLRSVIFAPEDLNLVKGDPADRRRFIDDVLVQRAPRYASVRSEYERVVKQRTALLRSLVVARGSGRTAAEQTLEVWDTNLARTGAELLFGRLSLLNELGSLVQQAYASVAPGKAATIAYQSKNLQAVGAPEDLPRDRDQLELLLGRGISEHRSAEIVRGMTLVGPHRDEVLLKIGDLPAKTHASHGECWSLALAMRLGSFELMRALPDGSGDPVLILDDVFAELDQQRRSALASVAATAEQVLVTAAVADDVPTELAGTRFIVSEGAIICE